MPASDLGPSVEVTEAGKCSDSQNLTAVARQVPSVKTDGQWHQPRSPAKLSSPTRALANGPSKKVHQGGRFAALADLHDDDDDGRGGFYVFLQYGEHYFKSLIVHCRL